MVRCKLNIIQCNATIPDGTSLFGQVFLFFLFVPEFEEAMGNTSIGGITRPFKSQFGWHILQVIERRKEDMSDKMKRNQAANVLRSRRFEEEFQLWLTQIREEAYVETKL